MQPTELLPRLVGAIVVFQLLVMAMKPLLKRPKQQRERIRHLIRVLIYYAAGICIAAGIASL